MTNSTMHSVFAAQQQKALSLRSSTAEQRIASLKKLMAAVNDNRQAIYDAAYADLRKPEAEVDLTEIFPVVAEIKHTIRHLEKWMKPRRVTPTLAMLGASARIKYEPKGTSLIIVPWNYPINLAFGPLSSAISAGCTAIIKPSEITPNLSRVTRKILEAVFDHDEVAVFEGEVDVASELLALPFDHIFFTGSPTVGKMVMAAAAKNLASVTLELGGKSPTIVDETADIKKAARNISWGKFSNNGQTCIAPDYVLVHQAVVDAFVRAMQMAIEKAYGRDVISSTDYCRIVNQNHFERINDLLNNAIEDGAELACGGDVEAEQRFINPTLLLDVDEGSQIMEQEIFGPLLPIVIFNDISEAITLINSKPKPLALYIYSRNSDTIEQVLTETSAGGTCINHNVLHFLHLNLPFGGVNNSGLGKAHGIYGFKEFSHERSVLTEHFTITHMMFPPYTKSVRKLIKSAIRFFS